MASEAPRKLPNIYRSEYLSWLLNFDWLLQFWTYFDTIPHGVGWLSCAGFVFGEALYVIGSFARNDTRTVANTNGNCMGDAYDWLVSFMFFLGDLCWLPAVYCMMLEAINKDYEDSHLEDSKHEEEFLEPQRYCWFGIWWWDLEWWGAVCYFFGVAGFLTSSVTSIIWDCTYMNPTLHLWLTAYTSIAAGIFFLFAGGIYSMVTIHPWLFPTIFLPYKKKDWSSLIWWGMWTHWWGGFCFFMSGIIQYWYNDVLDNTTDKVFLIEQSFSLGLGSLLFHVGGIFLLAKQSQERYGLCRQPQ